MAITVEPLDFENNCVEGRQARDNNYLEIERDTREEWKLGEKNQETPKVSSDFFHPIFMTLKCRVQFRSKFIIERVRLAFH